MQKKTLLSVGSGSRSTELPSYFQDYELKILDINPIHNPDLCMDARDLVNYDGERFDVVYSSHNLEHFRHHDVLRVLDGMYHVLKDDGILYLVVPDILGVVTWMVENKLDLDAVVYEAPRGVVTVRDMIWGHAGNVRITPDEWYLHKTGFSKRLLSHALYDAAFKSNVIEATGKEIIAVAWKKDRHELTTENFSIFNTKLDTEENPGQTVACNDSNQTDDQLPLVA